MKSKFIYLLSGFIFGWGLLLSGMANPEVVKSFLTVVELENWNPSLVYVLVSASFTYALIYWWITFGRSIRGFKSLVAYLSAFKQGMIDKKLILGSILFGIGWGILGLCPAPSLVRLGLTPTSLSIWTFVFAMTAGINLHRLTRQK